MMPSSRHKLVTVDGLRIRCTLTLGAVENVYIYRTFKDRFTGRIGF